MRFYDERVLPRLLHFSMRQAPLAEYRRRVLEAADGEVLEIGIGSGLNVPFYREAARHVIGLEPSPALLAMARRMGPKSRVPLQLVRGSAESIPLDPHSIDTVVTTWTLCSIRDVSAALLEVRRVLKPSGQLLFVEHGRSTDAQVWRWQDRLTPVWKRFAGGCHLNRPIAQLVEAAGFRIDQLQTAYLPGPRPLTFMYEGRARAR